MSTNWFAGQVMWAEKWTPLCLRANCISLFNLDGKCLWRQIEGYPSLRRHTPSKANLHSSDKQKGSSSTVPRYYYRFLQMRTKLCFHAQCNETNSVKSGSSRGALGHSDEKKQQWHPYLTQVYACRWQGSITTCSHAPIQLSSFSPTNFLSISTTLLRQNLKKCYFIEVRLMHLIKAYFRLWLIFTCYNCHGNTIY